MDFRQSQQANIIANYLDIIKISIFGGVEQAAQKVREQHDVTVIAPRIAEVIERFFKLEMTIYKPVRLSFRKKA